MAASILLAAITPLAAPRASAYPIVTPPPHKTSTPEPTPTPRDRLVYGSTLAFKLIDAISSNGSHPGQIVRAALADNLMVDGRVVAPKGAPEQIRILNASPASNPDIYGYVDVYFEPFALANGATIPMRPPTSHLTIDVSAGHESTVGVEDTIGDIFIPGHIIYHIFRKGRNFEMQPGAEIRARTQATVTVARNGVAIVTTPAPVVMENQAPVSTFTAVPFATPHGDYSPLPRGKTTLPPKPTPSPTPSESPTPSASPSLSPSPSPSPSV
jgi:hypothetical protein